VTPRPLRDPSPGSRIPHLGNLTDGRHAEGRPSAIVARGLRIRRGANEVLHGLDLDVPSGQLVGLLGPSGSGKSTLMRAIVGVQIVAGGTITVLGLPAGDTRLRHRVGYVTQAPSIYSDLTVEENLKYFASVLGADGESTHRALVSVDMERYAGQRVSRLSGGELSRASLAVALLGKPEVLVLDEPTVGLDPVLRRDLWQLFARLASEGATLLVSSHVMDEATRCDRLVLLRNGEVLADATLAELLERTGAADADTAFLTLVEQTEVTR
jgi:ABC-2 type transport system ATP-binding protein